MAKKNVWRGLGSSISSATLFLTGGVIFLAFVCAFTLIAFASTILFTMSAVWHKMKQLTDRKNKNG
jgi:hypothetical protein